MHVKTDKVENLLEVTSKNYLDQNVHRFVDMGYVEGLQLLLKDIANKSNYAPGERILMSDLSRIRNVVAMIHNQMRDDLIEEHKDPKSKLLVQYDIFPAMVAVNDYLYAMTMKALGSPDIPESFGHGMQDLIRDIAHKTEFDLKETDYLKASIDRCYNKQRGESAKNVRKATGEIGRHILNKKASSVKVAKYAGEYFALKKRQEGHGKAWRFFHKKENDARTKLLADMEKTLQSVLGENDTLENLTPQKIAEIYNKQRLSERATETFQKGIAKRNGVPQSFIEQNPTTTARADKERDNPDKDDIELENEFRMPLTFDEEFIKDSEPVEITYVTKVNDKIVTKTVVHDDGDREVDLSTYQEEKSPVAKF